MIKSVLSVLVALFLASALFGQNTEIQGKVTMFNTYPVSNLPVFAKKAKTTVTTDSAGMFTLLCKEKDVIMIQGKAYQTTSRKVDDRTGMLSINIVFKDTPKNRKLVVSSGNITHENLVYGLSNLQAENNDYCSYDDIFSLIRSQFPEVEVKPNQSGSQGIYLRRGPKSMLQDTQTLYIVDGMRTRDISFINPCEIADITILKEGASAKYGAGSSNGAVVITSKRAPVN